MRFFKPSARRTPWILLGSPIDDRICVILKKGIGVLETEEVALGLCIGGLVIDARIRVSIAYCYQECSQSSKIMCSFCPTNSSASAMVSSWRLSKVGMFFELLVRA